MSDRRRARELAAEALAAGEPIAFFERLYAEAAAGEAVVPWADLVPNPHLVEWLDRESPTACRALDVGCGYGDNAAELARRGFDTLGFDVSPTAVAHARERFGSLARFEAADGSAPPPEWRQRFGLVTEVYTLQALPPEPRAHVAKALAELVAPGGTLLVICRGRDEDEPVPERPPSPLARSEIESIGLELVRFEDFMDGEDPPVRRFRVELRKPSSSE